MALKRLFNFSVWSSSAITASGTLTSGALDLRHGVPEALLIQATSVSGAADVRVQYEVSVDGVTFGAAADNPDLISSTNATFATTPEGLNRIDLSGLNAPYIALVVTELTGSLTDTLVTLTVTARE